MSSNAPHYLGQVSKWRWKHKPKPWWNKEINALWRSLVDSENEYRSYYGKSMIKRHLLQRFCEALTNVDKTYKKSKSKFQREQQDEIEKLNTSDKTKYLDK